MQPQEPPSAQASDGREKQGSPRRRFFETRYWLRDLILSILLAFIVIVFLYQPVQVEGTSMMPRLENHERIFINKFVYRFEPIQRGDIVVFEYPLDTSKSYIKRVVGLPGEWVSIQDGRALVNDEPLAEPYLPASYLDHQSYAPVHVEARSLLRAGGPPGFFQRQQSLGDRRSQVHLRQSGIRLLAFQRVWTSGMNFAPLSVARSPLPGVVIPIRQPTERNLALLGDGSKVKLGCRLGERTGARFIAESTLSELQRSFAEFTLSGLRRFFASLRMTSEGLRMTANGLRMTQNCKLSTVDC